MTSLETALHREFKERRIISSKEWFYMNNVDEIIQYIENVFSTNTNVTIYKTQEEIAEVYKNMDDYMNSPLKIGKNPEQQRSGLKVKNRVLCIQAMIYENESITPNQVLEKMNDYSKADLRYDIQNGYFIF